jgi:hypothetical protein
VRSSTQEEDRGKPGSTAVAEKASEGKNARRVGFFLDSWRHGSRSTDFPREQTFEAASVSTSVDAEEQQGRIGLETGTDLGKEQNPEGAKLRSVAGAKQTRQGYGVVLRDRLAESVETLRAGSGGSWQTRRQGLRILQALKSARAQEGCLRRGVEGL